MPALANVPAPKVHQPGQLSADEQRRYQLRLGVDYPNPIVDLQTSVQANEAVYQQALARKNQGHSG
jgi:deoxyribodipyrimidine photo-lyase